MRVLVVEDESSISDTLVYALQTEGFEAVRAATLQEARSCLKQSTFDLIVLDVGLPDGSGFEFCKEIRKTFSTPILFLTARNNEIDKIVGLEIGADDYVTKPFSPREVTARVKVILKRSSGNVPGRSDDGTQSSDESFLFRVDDERKKIFFHNQALELSRYEYGLLKVLVRQPGRVWSREQLMEKVWESPDMSLDRTVDAHIKMIRGKLRMIAPNEEWIVTHRGLGYSLKETA